MFNYGFMYFISFYFLQKALPLRHKELHWMNVPKYLATLFALLKTFLSQKLQERVSKYAKIQK